MNGGLLSTGPAGFAKEHNSRWLLTAYEAGDIVFHNSYAVSNQRITIQPLISTDQLIITRSTPRQSIMTQIKSSAWAQTYGTWILADHGMR